VTYEEACAKCGIEPFKTTAASKALFVETVAALVKGGDADPRHYAVVGAQFEEFG